VEGADACPGGTIYTCSVCGGNAWTITGISQCEAASADTFSISWSNPNTTPSTACVNFSNATSVASLATQLNCVAGLTVQHQGGGTILFLSPFLSTITNLTLTSPGIAASPSRVDIAGVDPLAAVADTFTLDIDGNPVDTNPVDFSLATDGSTLAAELNNIVGIDVTYSSTANGTISVVATTPGAFPFSNISLTAPIVVFGDGFESGDLIAWSSSQRSSIYFAGDLWATGSLQRAVAAVVRDRNGVFPGQIAVRSGEIVVFQYDGKTYVLAVSGQQVAETAAIEVHSAPASGPPQFDPVNGAIDRSDFDRWLRGR